MLELLKRILASKKNKFDSWLISVEQKLIRSLKKINLVNMLGSNSKFKVSSFPPKLEMFTIEF